MIRFQGIWIPLVTPFRDQHIDFAALKALARRYADTGIAGLVVCGSTGEAQALDHDEQLAVLDAVIDAAPAYPILMGIAGSNLQTNLALLTKVQQRPIDGLLISPPSYIRPSQAGIIDYFHHMANAAQVPIVLYNIPYRTGVNMTLETICTLAGHERIVAIKDCGGDMHVTMQLIADGRLAVLAGEDMQIFSTLCLGGAGAIAACAHLHPELFVRMFDCISENAMPEARQIFYRLLPMMKLLFEEPNPAAIKAALARQGWIDAQLRAPMQAASSALIGKLIKTGEI